MMVFADYEAALTVIAEREREAARMRLVRLARPEHGELRVGGGAAGGREHGAWDFLPFRSVGGARFVRTSRRSA